MNLIALSLLNQLGCGVLISSREEYQAMLDYATDDDGDGFAEANGDCDDDDPSVHPDAEEIWYDGVDQDCDRHNDQDADYDGHVRSVDCDDQDPEIHPDREDTCNGLDDDCDDATDEGLAQIWYRDDDGDGYGDSEDRVSGCLPPEGYVAQGGDCDDTEADVHLDAETICGDGLDNDCDGLGDCGFALEGSDRVGSELARIDGDSQRPLAAVSMLGGHDWTGDGVLDLVIGVPERRSGGAAHEGGVYLFSAPIEGELSLDDAGRALEGEEGFDLQLGGHVAAGDLDDDGEAELIIGASTSPSSDSAFLEGFVYIVDAPITNDLRPIEGANVSMLLGEEPGDEFGANFVLGDFLGDEAVDLIVGAPRASSIHSGNIYMVEGPLNVREVEVEDVQHRLLFGDESNLEAGRFLANGGDLDADGQDELLIGFPDWKVSREGVFGRVGYIASAPQSQWILLNTSDPHLQHSGDVNVGFGETLEGLGDVNEDGYDDALVGAPGYVASGEEDAGRAWVLSGAEWSIGQENFNAPEAFALATFVSDDEGTRLAASAEDLGDVNDDGLTDLALGVAGYGDRAYGAAVIFESPLEGTVELGDATFTFEGISGISGMGSALASAGDLDAMGITEIAVGWTSSWGGLALLSPDTF